MANLQQMQNGRVKMVRNRFGGENKRPRVDEYGSSRRSRLDTLITNEQVAEIDDVLREDTSRATPVPTRFCPTAQAPAPINGVVHQRGDDCDIVLKYEGGKLASAHCRSTSFAYRG
jgi:hypothetical protein